MQCFSLPFLRDLLVWLVVVGGIVLILRLIIPALMGLFNVPAGGTVIQVLNIVCGIIVGVFVIYLVFDLLQCALGGGLSLPALRH